MATKKRYNRSETQYKIAKKNNLKNTEIFQMSYWYMIYINLEEDENT